MFRVGLKRICFCTLAVVAAVPAVRYAVAQEPATLTIDTKTVKAKVSPKLYGLMTEEINYSYDGGLYGELVSNRVFMDRFGVTRWFLHPNGAAEASMEIDHKEGPSAALTRSLALTVTKASAKDWAGVVNNGYWGIPIRPKERYKGSFWAKADSTSVGPVRIRLINNNSGQEITTEGVSTPLTTEWKEYQFELVSGTAPASQQNQLILSVENPGKVWFSLVSLFPPTYKDRVNGNRIDLSEKLAAMNPRFLRFPGGNYLEGDHINERFEWKKTIGPLVDRPTHPSPWRYHSTDGMGLLEFLLWCEDLHMQPLLAVYGGYSMMQEHVNPGPDLDPYVQDALEEIEYVTGSTSTKWGAQRAKDGHPEPFHLSYVEVGNEDWFDKSGSYDGRYAQYYKAIKAKYPDLQIIATTTVKGIKPDVIDDHYYKTAEEFYAMDKHYDTMDRTGPKIFVGEWATREGGPTPNMGAALGDAAFMTSMERNSDLIVMASYAPLLVNVNAGGMQWESDLIGYDSLSSYGSPSYYAQVLFNEYLGDEILAGTAEGAPTRFHYSATRSSQTGVIHLKLVNGSSEPQTMTINLTGAGKVASTAKLITLSGKTLGETNTLWEPTKIVPVETEFKKAGEKFTYTLPAYSIHVLELQTK
ncbi:alpha-L-arabinofuranosidase C-terminal domain-containing protein [Granulicella sibirica]|uniref:non-reducing end alpha-L-arabinofuranosidase n=1 Tax=Granulicella sibirica TaxID=2479048 RepID=A0A4Q0T4Q1_9BACT|nr:alpha-L-arabinofuranosidase C-terminal domain-containing protein [Granulicella sibirica]RXH58715.1 Alpha-N-arabinofuranosidase [Granulicella sibirica]